MSRRYQRPELVPLAVLLKRLDELVDVITAPATEKPGNDMLNDRQRLILGTFLMRIPAEADFDPDIVISEAARRLRDNVILQLDDAEALVAGNKLVREGLRLEIERIRQDRRRHRRVREEDFTEARDPGNVLTAEERIEIATNRLKGAGLEDSGCFVVEEFAAELLADLFEFPLT